MKNILILGTALCILGTSAQAVHFTNNTGQNAYFNLSISSESKSLVDEHTPLVSSEKGNNTSAILITLDQWANITGFFNAHPDGTLSVNVTATSPSTEKQIAYKIVSCSGVTTISKDSSFQAINNATIVAKADGTCQLLLQTSEEKPL